MAKIKLDAMKISECVDLLRQMGSKTASEETINGLISSGMPINSDGTISLIVMTAWILKVNHG